MEIGIKALSPDLAEAYLDFFDHRAFSDGSPYYPCYCNAFNMSTAEIDAMREESKAYGGGTEGWKQALRGSASRLVKEGRIRGYLAFDGGTAVGWCNANDRMNYFRVGEFDLDHVPEDRPPERLRYGQVRSVVCFEICPEYRGRGIAGRLLRKVCDDAKVEGYECVEGYPVLNAQAAMAFTGPAALYRKLGFTEYAQSGNTAVMRKYLHGDG